ncbi:chromatin modification-related protein EAF7-domain-containing protein [Calycina marina]|uniref:Chromatin modification-related protein EAF7-domain-containing protein n=1 Tax=Calycina marina TaxID=1763456 RepID=A0A9P7YXH6_9HELO|nr:chromatin modification-related protein EAF7-domain-containing protein [Calycina marina]
MPPRKKGKSNAATAEVLDEDAMAIDAPTPEDEEPAYDMLKDPWTDEQEISLFKGVMKWKPNGMHKHFRMLALSEYLRNHGYDQRAEPHISIQGIRKKLDTMYDMAIIDERENTFVWEDDLRDKYEEFALPNEWEHDCFMTGKRTSSEPPSSPSQSENSAPAVKKRKRRDTITVKTRASTVEETDDAMEASPPPTKAIRSVRPTKRGAGRAADSSQSRQPSKDTTADDETVGDEEEEKEDGTQDGEEEAIPSPKPKSRKGKGAEKPTARKSKRKK